MKRLLYFVACAFLLLTRSPLFGQEAAADTSTATITSATATLAALNQAFSGGKLVSSVTMNGNADWTAGSTQDSGPVTLTISPSGIARMELSFGSEGPRSEQRSGRSTDLTCHWSDKDGNAHDVDSRNCFKPLVWFAPAFSLQPSVVPTTETVADLGLGSAGSESATYHHLQAQFIFPAKSAADTKEITRLSTTDLGLDSTSYLPTVLSYDLVPDKGADTPISIEVRYSKYTTVNGVQLPFSIQRYVNGSLQLDITISNAEVQ